MIESSYTIAGAITGLIVGITGVGGGALMTPILLIVFGINPATAIATDLWFAAITKLVAAGIHNKGKRVDWQIVKRLWLGSLPVALLIVVIVSFAYQVNKIDWLTKAIGVVVLITAVGLLFAPKLLSMAKRRQKATSGKAKKTQSLLTTISGAILGLCVALTSVGAGALGSVMLIYLYPLRLTPHRLVATDLVHAIPLAIVAGLGYLFSGLVNWNILANLLVGSIPAIIIGSLLAGKISGRCIQLALAIVLLIVGVKTLMQ